MSSADCARTIARATVAVAEPIEMTDDAHFQGDDGAFKAREKEEKK